MQGHHKIGSNTLREAPGVHTLNHHQGSATSLQLSNLVNLSIHRGTTTNHYHRTFVLPTKFLNGRKLAGEVDLQICKHFLSAKLASSPNGRKSALLLVFQMFNDVCAPMEGWRRRINQISAVVSPK